MAERKNLTIAEVKSVEKVGKNQTPKLSFKARDGDKEQWYFSFRTSLFEAIKEGQTINADVETSSREYNENTYTDRKVVQIYVDGQPLGGQKSQYRGKSPEELELSAKSYALSYAKDLAVAQLIPLKDITKQADTFYQWLRGNGNKPASSVEKREATAEEQEFENLDKPEIPEPTGQAPTGKKVQNVAELKSLLMKHKVGTREVYEILSINSLMELTDLDEAWAKVKEAKGIQ